MCTQRKKESRKRNANPNQKFANFFNVDFAFRWTRHFLQFPTNWILIDQMAKECSLGIGEVQIAWPDWFVLSLCGTCQTLSGILKFWEKRILFHLKNHPNSQNFKITLLKLPVLRVFFRIVWLQRQAGATPQLTLHSLTWASLSTDYCTL